MRPGRPLAAILPSTQAGLRTVDFWTPPGAVWDLSGSPPGQSSDPLGALLGLFGPFLGPSRAVSDPSEALFEACSAEKLKKPKTFKNHLDFDDFRRFGLLFAPLGALLQHLSPLLGPLRPRWNISRASWAVLKASWTHLGPSGRPFGALLGRLGRAQGGPGGPSEAPKLTRDALFYLSVSLFGFVRCFRHLWVPFWAVFGASWGPLGALLGHFFVSFWTLWGRRGPPLPQTPRSKNSGAAVSAPSGAFNQIRIVPCGTHRAEGRV